MTNIQIESAQNLSKGQEDTLIDIAFTNIIYDVKISKQRQLEGGNLAYENKTILHEVSGIFKGGEVTAIMGSSGAGKTTLLNIISGRIGNFKGQLYANDEPYSYETFGNFANYVMQSDILMETMTVRQTLMFAAKIRNSDSSRTESRINYLANKLKLQKCLDVLVGGPMLKGISGGQKKRTSIAVQLMNDPKVIALDQPTSGMDSLTSFIIVNELRQLAKQGKTIFLTIHQPSSEIFRLFDNLILMVEGRIIYQGCSQNTINYFHNNFNLDCPLHSNPADFFMSILHNSPENTIRYEQYFKIYNQTLAQTIKKEIQNRKKDAFIPQISERSLANSLGQLIRRDVTNSIRNPIIFKARLIQTIIISLFVGGLYFNAGTKDYTEIISWNTIVGLCFFMSVDLFVQSLGLTAIVFPNQRIVFLKEENSKLYGVFQYFLSRNIIQLPFMIILPFLYTVICYWMIGLSSTPEQFFTTYLILLLLYFIGCSFGLLVGSILKEGKEVGTFVPIVLFPFLLVSGFFKNSDNMPKWFGWVQYFSPFKYGFSSLLNNQTLYKQSAIEQLNFDLGLWPSILVLVAIGLSVRFLSLLLLWYKKGKLE